MMKTVTSIFPKLGFAGVGWIGRHRMNAIDQTTRCKLMAAADPNTSVTRQLKSERPDLHCFSTFEEMLESDLDGVVIATPSALHARQAMAALQKGKAVFCQKPLGRDRRETKAVVNLARKKNLLIGVDFSYRHTDAVQKLREKIKSGDPGRIYAIDLTFHNAWGPDKPWYRDPDLSGGGCLMDLGIHLVDLLYELFDHPEISDIQGSLFNHGEKLSSTHRKTEDYAAVQFLLNHQTVVRLSCSWNLPAGKDAMISAVFYGEREGLAFRNVNGSFYDFVAESYSGTDVQTLSSPPDDWGGRGAVQWTEQLMESNRFDSSADQYIDVATTLDLIYQNCLS